MKARSLHKYNISHYFLLECVHTAKKKEKLSGVISNRKKSFLCPVIVVVGMTALWLLRPVILCYTTRKLYLGSRGANARERDGAKSWCTVNNVRKGSGGRL